MPATPVYRAPRRDANLRHCAVQNSAQGAASHLLVHVPDAPWDGQQYPGVTVVAESDGPARPTVLALADEADDQIVLKTALAMGPVREFTRRRPSLTELFRHVITEQGRAACIRRHCLLPQRCG